MHCRVIPAATCFKMYIALFFASTVKVSDGTHCFWKRILNDVCDDDAVIFFHPWSQQRKNEMGETNKTKQWAHQESQSLFIYYGSKCHVIKVVNSAHNGGEERGAMCWCNCTFTKVLLAKQILACLRGIDERWSIVLVPLFLCFAMRIFIQDS